MASTSSLKPRCLLAVGHFLGPGAVLIMFPLVELPPGAILRDSRIHSQDGPKTSKDKFRSMRFPGQRRRVEKSKSNFLQKNVSSCESQLTAGSQEQFEGGVPTRGIAKTRFPRTRCPIPKRHNKQYICVIIM